VLVKILRRNFSETRNLGTVACVSNHLIQGETRFVKFPHFRNMVMKSKPAAGPSPFVFKF